MYGNAAASAAGLAAGGDSLESCSWCFPPVVIAALWGHDEVARAWVEARCVGLSADSPACGVLSHALSYSLRQGRVGLLECVSRVAPAALHGEGAGRLLVYAAQSGDIGVVRAVLASAPEVRVGVLGSVCGTGVRARVRSFDSGGCVQIQRGSHGSEALAAALCGGHNEIAAALLDAGVHPDAWRGDERTPIFAAVEAGNVAGVELMVSRGAKVNATDGRGATLLQTAGHSGNWPVVERLLDAGADTGEGVGRLLSAIVTSGNEACLSSALEALPRRLGRSLTPSELAEGLCGAVSYGTDAMVRVLLAAGAPPNGDGGFRLLRNAGMDGKPAMIRVLMEAGADPEASVHADENSAIVRMVVGRADRAREALARLPPGSPLQRFDSGACRFGRTWLTLAALSGSRECVELAWERGAYRACAAPSVS